MKNPNSSIINKPILGPCSVFIESRKPPVASEKSNSAEACHMGQKYLPHRVYPIGIADELPISSMLTTPGFKAS